MGVVTLYVSSGGTTVSKRQQDTILHRFLNRSSELGAAVISGASRGWLVALPDHDDVRLAGRKAVSSG